MADAPVTPDLHGAVEDFLAAYRAKYRNTGKGGMRSNAPMLAEVTALNAAFRAPPSPPVAAPAERSKHERTKAVLDHVRRLEGGHNRNPFRPLLERLMTTSGSSYSITEILQMKNALDGFYGAPQPPRPGTAPLSDEQIIRAAVAAMPHTNPGVADDLLGGFTMHTEAEDIVAIWKAAAGHPTTTTPKD